MESELKISYEEQDGYLKVEVEGKWSREGALLMVDEITSHAQNNGYTRILADVRKMSAPEKEIDRYIVSEYAAKK